MPISELVPSAPFLLRALYEHSIQRFILTFKYVLELYMPRKSQSAHLLSDAALASLHGLGGRLKEARLRRNWTQALAAEKAGLSESSVKKVEAGTVNITASAYLALLDIYGLPKALDKVLAPGDDTLGEALSKEDARQRARNPQVKEDEWAF